MRLTPLMAFYGLFAIAGAIIPWYFNITHVLQTGETITPQSFFAAGFTTPLASSLTSDFMIGSTPVMVWMMVESGRLRMRRRWVYLVAIFMVAFAFACPLFLLMRERKLQARREMEST